MKKPQPQKPNQNQKKIQKQSQPQKPVRAVKIVRTKQRKLAINEIAHEPTAGGIVFRRHNNKIQILLIQDAKNRWTIPKGHIEIGETPERAAIREINEETGLTQMELLGWLGKIEFRYRRLNRLVLMTTQVYLVLALSATDNIKKEEWMTDIKWFNFDEAINKIEYEDISKLMLLAMSKIRAGGY